MQIPKKVLIALLAATFANGCASGGGSGTVTYADGTSRSITPEEFWGCLVTLMLGCGAQPAGAARLERDRDSVAPSISAGFSWDRSPIANVWVGDIVEDQQAFRYDAQGVQLRIGSLSEHDKRSSLAPLGHAGIDVQHVESLPGYDQSPFTSLPALGVAAVANPFDLGWDYQSFGAWNGQGRSGGYVHATTFGAPTPGASVPTTGSAAFTGKLAGFYLSSTGTGYTAAADLNVQANFGNRTLNLSSSGTVLTRNFTSGTPAPHLNVSGTLNYAAGSSTFNGTLANTGGTMSGASQGRFYGPAAQELGGVFTLKSPTTVESFAGAYGAKR